MKLNKIVKFSFYKDIAIEDVSKLNYEINKLDFEKSYKLDIDSVSIDFIPELSKMSEIRGLFNTLGYKVRHERVKRPRRIKNFIEKIAASNQKSFGNKRLDCCGITNKQ